MPSMHSVGLRSNKTLVEEMKLLEELHGPRESGGGRKAISSELWHACAGPLVSLPLPGNLVYYFPQGHTEQVTASTKRLANAQIPCYPNLTSQMMCQVHNVTLHADKETDEIYAQITLQPVNSENDVFPIPDFGQTKSKQPSEFFCKTLTASDTSTHGGFSVPRRAAEKLFPPLDHSTQPPSQELVVRDLHENTWTFRHIYRGQPKRHLLTTGWSVFVGAKRLKAGDSVLFIRDEKSQLLLGIRRANRQQTVLPSSVLSADSMHIGVLAAAAHASANRTPFTIYYNPRACPSEFVVPLAKYHRAAYGTQVSVGMRFGMMFEAEDSTKCRHMGTIMGISDSDPLRWSNSKWRNLQVEWDEHGCIERPCRVSLWEIETPENLFSFASPISVLKRPYNTDSGDSEGKNMIKRPFQQVPEPGDIIKALLKPHISSNPGLHVGYHQSVYASLMQNAMKFEPTLLPCTETRCYDQGNRLIPNSLCQTGNQNDYAPFIWQQVLPLQHLKEESPNVYKCAAVVSDSKVHTPSEVVMNDPLPTMNNNQNASTESKNHSSSSGRENVNNGSKAASTEVSTSLDENAKTMTDTLPQLQSEILDKDQDKCLTNINPTNSRSQVLNQDPAFLLERSFQMQDRRNDSDPSQSSHADATQLDFSDPGFPLLDEIQLPPLDKCYMDSLGWMFQPSYDPPNAQKPKAGLPPFYGSDNSRTTSADISVVVNPENFTSTCTSELSGDQCSLAFGQESLSSQLPNNETVSSQLEEQPPYFLEQCSPRSMSTAVHSVSLNGITVGPGFSYPYELRDILDSNDSPNEILSSLHFQVSNGSIGIARPMANASVDKFNTAWNSELNAPLKVSATNIGSCQDVQSHVMSSLTDFSLRELHGFSGGTSSNNLEKNCQLNMYSWKQASPPLRTYTKVQKLGSVGRCIDVTHFRNYEELISAITCMFGLEDQLNDPRCSEWKLVYVDYENDMLLVGDDPWEEFVNCVRCIRILSPTEVQQMSHEGLPFIDDPGDSGAFHTEENPFLDETFMPCQEKKVRSAGECEQLPSHV